MMQGFEATDNRFESMDKRSEELQRNMDRRFDAVDRRFALLQWAMGLGFVVLGTLVSVFGILA